MSEKNSFWRHIIPKEKWGQRLFYVSIPLCVGLMVYRDFNEKSIEKEKIKNLERNQAIQESERKSKTKITLEQDLERYGNILEEPKTKQKIVKKKIDPFDMKK